MSVGYTAKEINARISSLIKGVDVRERMQLATPHFDPCTEAKIAINGWAVVFSLLFGKPTPDLIKSAILDESADLLACEPTAEALYALLGQERARNFIPLAKAKLISLMAGAGFWERRNYMRIEKALMKFEGDGFSYDPMAITHLRSHYIFSVS